MLGYILDVRKIRGPFVTMMMLMVAETMRDFHLERCAFYWQLMPDALHEQEALREMKGLAVRTKNKAG